MKRRPCWFTKPNSVGVELFYFVNTVFCFNKFVWLLATWVETLYLHIAVVVKLSRFSKKGDISWEWNLSDPHYNIKQIIFLTFCSHCWSKSPCVFVESIRHLQTSWGKASIGCCFKKAFIVRSIMFYAENWQWTYINMTKCHDKFIFITENFSLEILRSEFFFVFFFFLSLSFISTN